MKLTLEPTEEMQTVNGEQARVWKGEDENGTHVIAFVRAVVPLTHDPVRLEAFEQALRELKAAPSTFDIRLIN